MASPKKVQDFVRTSDAVFKFDHTHNGVAVFNLIGPGSEDFFEGVVDRDGFYGFNYHGVSP